MGVLSRLGISKRKKLKHPIRQRYFGISDLCFNGGVFAPDAPAICFHVGLIDASGEILYSAKANKNSVKAEIPDGHGFTLPIPYEWLSPSEKPRLFQFKILETGEVFPKIPREFPTAKLLRKQQQHETETVNPLPSHIRHLTYLVSKTASKKTLVVGTHDMNRTGAPMIILEIVKQLKQHHDCEIILLCLGPRASLFPEFDQHCLVIIENLETAFKSAKKETKELFDCLGQSIGRRVALINSLCSTKLAEACGEVGLDVRSLIHEYPHAFEAEWIKRHFDAANGVVFPCQDVCQSYVSQELAIVSGDQANSHFSILPQGCYQLEKPPLDENEADNFAEAFRKKNHIGPNDRLVVSCGTLDSRKGFDWFAALMQRYADISPNTKTTHFLWIGHIGEWELFFHALHDLRQKKIVGRFHHLDEMEDVRIALRLADVFLLCSRIDPFPSVVLESFLAGVPVIGFDKGQGSCDMIRETGFGTVVPYLNLEETIKAIDDLAGDSWKSQRVQNLGASFVKEHFQYNDYVDTLAEWLLNGASLDEAASGADYSLTPEKPVTLAPVILMGFHRSATSYLSEFLHSIGVNMNPSGRFLEGGQGNPGGHFEDLLILDYHCKLMQTKHPAFMDQWGGQRCIFLPDYNCNWEEFIPETKALCHHLAQRTPWGWKDPRSLLFLDHWNTALDQNIKILTLRHPLEIFLSLLRRDTDPYFFANPLAFFKAYENYHQSALADYERNPDDWFVISMPPNADSLESLHSFLIARLGTDLQPLTDPAKFDESRFHSLDITSEIEAEFHLHFPRTAVIHDRFDRLKAPKPVADEKPTSPTDHLNWLESTFATLLGSNFSLHLELQKRTQEIARKKAL